MKNAVAYVRVSTKGQVGEDKFGIDSQKDIITKYAHDHNLNITSWYVDEGVSGAERHRPALDRLLGGAETNPPTEFVLVARADRIARDISLYYAIKYLLHEQSIDILSATEDWSTQDKLVGQILETFLALVAEIEKDNIRTRMTGGRTEKAKRGGYAGGHAPMGYRVQNGFLVINEGEAPVVRRVFELRKRGLTMQKIADALNDEGYHTRRGGKFQISTVQSILNNERTYRGEYHYAGGDWVKGEQEPILTDGQ